MADVVVDAETTNPAELTAKGFRAYMLRDYNTSVVAYSRAIEIIAAEHGDKHESLGEIYVGYGRTLLELSRSEADALGDAVPRKLNSDSEAEEDNNENIENEKREAGLNNGVEGDGDKQNGKAEAGNDDTEPDAANAAEEEPSDLQLAWEVLELAKLIFEQRGAEGRKGLSEALILLGDVSLENENFEDAVTDMKAGLAIQKEILSPHSRTMAETYYKLGIALSINNQIDEAIENYNASLEVLNKRLVVLKQNEAKERDEIRDIDGLIPDIQEKIADMKSYKEEARSELAAAFQTKSVINDSNSPPSDKTVCDISHLVKRKRTSDDSKEESADAPAKKLSV